MDKPKAGEEDENEIILESEELRSDKHEEQLDLISFAVGNIVRSTKRYTDEQAQAYRDIVLRVCEAMPENEDCDDVSCIMSPPVKITLEELLRILFLIIEILIF